MVVNASTRVKVDGGFKLSTDLDITATINGNTPGDVIARRTPCFGPGVAAIGIKLGNIGIFSSTGGAVVGAGTGVKVDGAGKRTTNICITAAICGSVITVSIATGSSRSSSCVAIAVFSPLGSSKGR